MVEHRQLFEDVTADLARAGFDTGRGPSGLRIDRGPQGVVIGWPPTDGPADDPPPAEGIRAAVTGTVAAVLRETGYRVAEVGSDELIVTGGPAPAVPPEAAEDLAREPAAVPEQWWG
ncbi:hypothetical protein GCM10009639_16800 [Kitasatospora putterlickiae]|uniref:Uncharacterized protein n=1 Tax=Kitasatospora putterlickiae TaxID=221725 RepID=A0ABP4IK03_9ACTN